MHASRLPAALDSTPCVYQGQDAMIKANPTSSCTLRIVCAGDPDSILYELHADNVVRVREKLQLSEIVITLLVDQGSLLCFGSVAAVPLTATIRVSADNLATIARDLRGFSGLPPTDERRKFVVILNPVSGASKGRQTFEEQVLPALQSANIEVDIRLTTSSGHARTLARELEDGVGSPVRPVNWAGIIVLGGDGTVMEVQEGNVTGHRLPIAVIPTGSDNSLAATLGIWSIHHAVLAIIKGPIIPADMMAVHEVNDDGSVGDWLANPTCICGLGFTADVIHEIHTHRWSSGLSPAARTLCYGLRQFFCLGLTRHTTQVSYVPSAARMTVCSIPDGQYCATCEGAAPIPVSPPKGGSKRIQVGLNPVTAMAIGCMRAKNMSAGPDAAMYPCAHFGDGALDVVTVGDVPEIEFFRRAFCVVFRGKRDTGVEAEYVKATEVLMEYDSSRALGGKFVVNCDGDPRYPKTKRVICKVLPREGRLFAYRRLQPESTARPLQKQVLDGVLDVVDFGLIACGSAWSVFRQFLGYKVKSRRLQAL